ncbi:MAG: zf-TFIIB domain-containing protein [Candidatus Microsaccharimonas sp.]
MTQTFGSVLIAGLPGNLINVATGMTPSELSYMYYLVISDIFTSDQTLGVCSIELPFKSGVHLLGAPRDASVIVPYGLNLGALTPVTLEGNYNDFFSLYVANDEQVQARYVLDPAAMVFTIDFCSRYYWEILDDTLYFMSPRNLPGFDIVDMFVKQIRPAVEVASDRSRNPAKLPYTHTQGRKLACPHCAETLVLGRAWMACPAGHGFLITGAQVLAERDSRESIDYSAVNAAVSLTNEPMTCPYCQNPMKASAYQHSSIIIDTCTKCPHRWIDGDEIEPVIGNGRLPLSAIPS